MFLVQHAGDRSYYHGAVGLAAVWRHSPDGAQRFSSEEDAFTQVFLTSLTVQPNDILVVPVEEARQATT